MAKLSPNSSSFLRDKKEAVYSMDLAVWQYAPKKEQLRRAVLNNFDRAVFFGENLRTKTKEELEEIKSHFRQVIWDAKISGIVELHLQGDQTSKSAHVHFWGRLDERTRTIIERTILELNLTQKNKIDYTSDLFDQQKAGEMLGEREIERIEEAAESGIRLEKELVFGDLEIEEIVKDELLKGSRKLADDVLNMIESRISAFELEIERIEEAADFEEVDLDINDLLASYDEDLDLGLESEDLDEEFEDEDLDELIEVFSAWS